MALFFRDAILIFGPVFQITDFPTTAPGIAFESNYDISQRVGLNALLPKYSHIFSYSVPKDNVMVSRLRIVFNVNKNMENNSNKSSIKVYNITKEKWDLLSNPKRELRATLYAGYLNNFTLIYSGDVTSTSYTREGSDWVGTIDIGDGEISLENSVTNTSCEDGTSLINALNKMVESIGSSGNIDVTKAKSVIASLPNIKATGGQVFCGKTKDTMAEILQNNGYRSYINNSELCIVSRDGGVTDKSIYLTPFTGLIGSPKNMKEGVSFKTLLIPGLDIGSIVTLDSYNIKGHYIVEKITYDGDTRGSNWYCECEGSEYLGIPENNPIRLYTPADGFKLFKPIENIITPENYPEDWKSNYKYNEDGSYTGFQKPPSGIDRFYDADGKYIGGGA